MGRHLRPLDPTEGPVAQLAYLLRELLLGAGLTYRKLEKVAHYDHTVLCRAASGVTVPTWKVAQAFVQGCLNAGGVTTESDLGKCILATVEGAWAAATEAQIVAVEAQARR